MFGGVKRRIAFLAFVSSSICADGICGSGQSAYSMGKGEYTGGGEEQFLFW